MQCGQEGLSRYEVAGQTYMVEYAGKIKMKVKKGTNIDDAVT